jgi:hypothetical protein
VLFEYIPEIYKLQDAESGGLLELFSESLRPSFDGLRRKIRDFIELRDPLLVRTQYDEVTRLRLGPPLGVKGTVEQRGVTASVNAVQQFVAPTARFKVSDVGKELFVSGSAFSQNNRRTTITSVINPTTVVTDPLLVVDTGPLRWELRTKVVPPTDRVTVEVRAGYVDVVTPGWLLFDGFADFTVIGRRQFKLPVSVVSADKQLLTEQEGLDGEIDAFGRFMSDTVQLDQQDVGKKLVLSGSTTPEHNDTFEITRVVVIAPGDVRAEIDATTVLAADQGLTWAILPYAELDLQNTVSPRSVIEQEGVGLTITVSGGTDATVVAPTASFLAGDVGKLLSLRGSTALPSNDGIYEVVTVVSATTAKIEQRSPVLLVEIINTLTWELRPASTLGDLTQVDVRAPSMIIDLAPDFGIEVDEQEGEDRQRSWVKNVSQWIELKGTHDGYRIIGAISGFDVTTVALFRFSTGLFDTIPDDHEFEVGETGAGRFGTNGTLSQAPSLKYRLTSPTALFAPTDVGRQIRIRNAAIAGNNKLYTIDIVVSATVVEFLITDIATLPDANNGALSWNIVRLYTDLPPFLPVYDEVKNDLLEDIVDVTSGGFLDYNADKYCWEDDFDATAHIEVSAVATISPGVHRVSVYGTLAFPTTPEVVLATGHWLFVSLVAGATSTGDNFTGIAPTITLNDATGAAFTDADIGKWIGITGATTPANNGVFLVTAVPSATSLTFFNGLGVSEAFPGTWQLYTENDFFLDSVPVLTGALAAPPITSGTGDAFTKAGSIITLTDAAGLFLASHVGKHILIAGSTTAGNNGVFVVTTFVGATQIKYVNAAGFAEPYGGAWSIGLALYSFNIASAVPPGAPTPGKLRYECPVQLTCDYCAASKVFALIEATDELLSEGGVAVERLLERVLLRMEDVTPIHVELITRFRASISASLTLLATIDPHDIAALLLAPLSAYYDDIFGDDIAADIVLHATIEPTIV